MALRLVLDDGRGSLDGEKLGAGHGGGRLGLCIVQCSTAKGVEQCRGVAEERQLHALGLCRAAERQAGEALAVGEAVEAGAAKERQCGVCVVRLVERHVVVLEQRRGIARGEVEGRGERRRRVRAAVARAPLRRGEEVVGAERLKGRRVHGKGKVDGLRSDW
jgi:hypothetical protein